MSKIFTVDIGYSYTKNYSFYLKFKFNWETSILKNILNFNKFIRVVHIYGVHAIF